MQNKAIDYTESDNYYIPMVDMLSGIVFILMILLTSNIMNIKYEEGLITDGKAEALKKEETIELYKKILLEEISSYLTKAGIENKIDTSYSKIIIFDHSFFEKDSPILTKKGRAAAKIISQALAQKVICEENNSDCRKRAQFLKQISLEFYQEGLDASGALPIARALAFYGDLISRKEALFHIKNAYNQRLFTVYSFENKWENLSKKLKLEKTSNYILLNFEMDFASQTTPLIHPV